MRLRGARSKHVEKEMHLKVHLDNTTAQDLQNAFEIALDMPNLEWQNALTGSIPAAFGLQLGDPADTPGAASSTDSMPATAVLGTRCKAPGAAPAAVDPDYDEESRGSSIFASLSTLV